MHIAQAQIQDTKRDTEMQIQRYMYKDGCGCEGVRLSLSSRTVAVTVARGHEGPDRKEKQGARVCLSFFFGINICSLIGKQRDGSDGDG